MTAEIDVALNWADKVWAEAKSDVFSDTGLTMSERCHVHTLAYEYRQAIRNQPAETGDEEKEQPDAK